VTGRQLPDQIGNFLFGRVIYTNGVYIFCVVAPVGLEPTILRGGEFKARCVCQFHHGAKKEAAARLERASWNFSFLLSYAAIELSIASNNAQLVVLITVEMKESRVKSTDSVVDNARNLRDKILLNLLQTKPETRERQLRRRRATSGEIANEEKRGRSA
jgi:hypothetical protein